MEKLTAGYLLFPPGLEMIDIAKKNGCWNARGEVGNLVVPGDLQTHLVKAKKAFKYRPGFTNSTRTQILDLA